MWLDVPVAEPHEGSGGTGKRTRTRKGTSRGGVISPLPANLLAWPGWSPKSGTQRMVSSPASAAARMRGSSSVRMKSEAKKLGEPVGVLVGVADEEAVPHVWVRGLALCPGCVSGGRGCKGAFALH